LNKPIFNLSLTKCIPQLIGVCIFLTITTTPALGQIKPGYDFFTVPSSINELIDNLAEPGQANNNKQAITFYILAYETSCIDITIKGLGFNRNRLLKKDSLWVFTVPAYPEFEADSVIALGIQVSATAPIAIYQGTSTQDPIPKNDYVSSNTLIPNHQIPQSDSISFFGKDGSYGYWRQVTDNSGSKWVTFVQSIEDSNEILIHHKVPSFLLTRPLNIVNSSPTFDTIYLDKGEFFSVLNIGKDFAASDNFQNSSYAKSLNNKKYKIHTLGGLSSVSLLTDWQGVLNQGFLQINPGQWFWCWEDRKPVTNSDTLFYWPTLRGYQGTTASLMALENNTQVYINGRLHVLNSFERMDTSVTEALVINSNKPLSGYGTPWPRYLDGRPITNTNIGSFTVTLSPADQLIKKARIPTLFDDNLSKHIFTLVTPAADTAQLSVNGQTPALGSFEFFQQDSSWCFAHLEVPSGIHNIQSSSGFMGYYYIYRPYDSTVTQLSDFTGNYGHNIPEYSTIPSDSFTVFVGTNPGNLTSIDQWTNAPLILCESDSLFFTFGAYQNVNWQWLAFDDTLSFQKISGSLYTLHLSRPGSYNLYLVDPSGCKAPDSIQVVVLKNTTPTISYKFNLSCTENSLDFSLNGPMVSYQWLFPDDSTQMGKEASYVLQPGQDSLQFKLVQNQNGCLDTLSKTILLDSINATKAPVVPNVITPNGDGVNDALCFSNFEKYEGCFEVIILNRDGLVVFNTKGANRCWPTKDLPTAVYFYIISYAGKTKNGFIHIQP
jgi:hypothetical protein